MSFRNVIEINRITRAPARHRLPRVGGEGAPTAVKLTGEEAPHARHPFRYWYMRQWLNRQRSNCWCTPSQKKIPRLDGRATDGLQRNLGQGQEMEKPMHRRRPSSSAYFDELTPAQLQTRGSQSMPQFSQQWSLFFAGYYSGTGIDHKRLQLQNHKSWWKLLAKPNLAMSEILWHARQQLPSLAHCPGMG